MREIRSEVGGAQSGQLKKVDSDKLGKRKMANEQLTNLTGTNGLDIVSQTKLYLSSDPQSAERYLETIKESIPLLLTKLKEYEKERESERNALIEEEKHLMRQKGDKERELAAQQKPCWKAETVSPLNGCRIRETTGDLRTTVSFNYGYRLLPM